MASNRHLGRIVTLQTLYELDFRMDVHDSTLDNDEVITRNIDRYSEVLEDKQFIEDYVRGVIEQCEKLDAFIQPLAPEWPLDQIARIDRVVLRMGAWEMQHSKQVPVKVVINEAVELAKAFGSDNSSKFINGVLGTAARELKLVSASSAKPPKTPKAPKESAKEEKSRAKT